MSLTAISAAPYHDDFLTSGNDQKNYVRILFNPGRAIQARELTQLQTALQSQIDRFGRSVYKEGTAVIDGNASVDNNCAWVVVAGDVGSPSLIGSTLYVDFVGSAYNGVSARVLGYTLDGSDTRFFVKYVSNDSATKLLSTFPASTELKQRPGPTGSGPILGTTLTADHIGVGTRISVESGVFFVSGCFVYTDAQSIFLPESDLSGYGVFAVSQSNVTYIEDSTLLDNSTGSSNYAAPGADRLAITLALQYVETLDDSLVHLMTLENGKVHIKARTEYSNLDRVMAQRTYEESGNYAVRPFQLDVREHLNDESNRGLLLAADGGLESKFAVEIEPSVAYVEGYRVELADKKTIVADKPRTVSSLFTVAQTLPVGHYIEVSSITNSQDLLVNTAGVFTISGGYTGTLRVRGASYVSGPTPSSIIVRLYVYDVAVTYASGAPIIITRTSGGGGSPFSGTISNGFALYESSETNAAFVMPYDAVSAVSTPNTFETLRTFSVTAVGGVATLTVSGLERIVSTNPNDYLATCATTGPLQVTSVSILSGGLVCDLVVAGGGSLALKVVARVSRANVSAAAKTLSTVATETVTFLSGRGSLLNYDILDLIFVKVGAVDITNLFVLDNGQRDTHYVLGAVILKNGETLPPGTITVSYRFFNHVYSSNEAFFTVNSYPFTGGSPAISYSEIPSYRGARLANCIDFRKKLTYSGDQLSPDSLFTAQATQYLGRIDKVVVNANGEFKLIEGNPSVNPVEPITPDASMVLHVLKVPAYAFAASDITVQFVDNKRYTMRDIGALDTRISNLEYYTSLSLLEKETTSMNIGDRFKNGIIVDSFRGHNVGDVTNPSYSCSMDRENGGLRPQVTENLLRLKQSAIGSDLVTNSGLITKSYTSAVLIDQPHSTGYDNVNPYNVFSWNGSIALSPSSDEWKDVNRRPDVIINQDGLYDSIAFLADETGVTGTQWNEWQTNWTGVSTSTVKSKLHSVKAPDGVLRQRVKTTSTSEQLQTRTGTKVSVVPETVLTNVGTKVLDVSFVPFIRSRKVYFKGENLKPSTVVYPYFDSKYVGSYCFSVSEAAFNANQYANANDATLYNNVVLDTEGVANELVTNDQGEVYGYIIIPNNEALRFRAGSRVFKLLDNDLGNDASANTKGEGFYSAQGLLETQETNIVSTRVPRLVSTQVTESRTSLTSSTKVTYVDPLAQSFIVGDISGGCFVTSIDLYFRSKDAALPVTVHIVAVENGVPTQKVVPFSRVTKRSVDVNASNDSSAVTTFTFEAPVHLLDGSEYAFVVSSNSDKYEIYTAQIGGDSIEAPGTRVTQNPYAGVKFKSQNASTWTPDQSKDIKFTIRRAVFSVGSSTVTFKEVSETETLDSASSPAYALSKDGTGISVYVGGVLRTTNYTVSGKTLTFSSPIPTTDVTVIYPMDYSILNLIAQQNVFTGCAVTWSAEINSDPAFDIVPGDNYDLKRKITRASSAVQTLTLTATLTNESNYLSPVIDSDRVSLVAVGNKINNSVADEDNYAYGEALCRYITREVDLINGAEQLNVYLTINRPSSSCDVKLYIRSSAGGELSGVSWTLVEPVRAVPVISDSDVYAEVEYIKELASFSGFQIKIVLISFDAGVVPTVKDFRAIASI